MFHSPGDSTRKGLQLLWRNLWSSVRFDYCNIFLWNRSSIGHTKTPVLWKTASWSIIYSNNPFWNLYHISLESLWYASPSVIHFWLALFLLHTHSHILYAITVMHLSRLTSHFQEKKKNQSSVGINLLYSSHLPLLIAVVAIASSWSQHLFSTAAR